MSAEDYTGTFRVDDVSLNTDFENLRSIFRAVNHHLPHVSFLLAVSPVVHDLTSERLVDRKRIFPKVLNAMSDHRVFFRADLAGLPVEVRDVLFVDDPEFQVRLASHGLLHLDHRLLGREAQELSILLSCSLVKSKVFVPPFNKWNRDTEKICREHGIELVKWEDGWRHAGHNGFDLGHEKYYLHEHDADAAGIARWIDEGLARGTAEATG